MWHFSVIQHDTKYYPELLKIFGHFKAILDHFHNFLHELSAKLPDFLLIAVKGPLNTENLFKMSRTSATFENLKYCVGGISVALCLCLMLPRTVSIIVLFYLFVSPECH